MLERASLCLESGGRHLLRGSKPRLRSRRMLHSSFWHHAALDLDLSVCWPSLLQPLPQFESPDHDDLTASSKSAAAHTTHQDALFLDFLYPAKTLALMRRLSSFGWEAWHVRHTRLANNPRVRQFSSSASGPDNGQGTTAPPSVGTASDKTQAMGLEDEVNNSNDAEFAVQFEDISPMPLGDMSELDSNRFSDDMEANEQWLAGTENAAEALLSLLNSDKSDSKMVWLLWQRTAKDSRTPELSAAVLDYLCSVKPFLPTLAEEVIAIFEALEFKDRRPSSYRGAIRAYLRLDQLGKAALVHQHGVESGIVEHGNIGTSDLLAHALKSEKWQLAVEVYSEMTNIRGKTQEFWSVAKKNLELRERFESLLLYFRRMRRLTGRDPEEQHQIHAFATELGYQAIDQYAPHSSSRAEERLLYHLIMRLKQSAYLEPRHYERALKGLLVSPSVRQAEILPLVVRKLYSTYISVAKADKSIVPSRELLEAMISALTRTMLRSHGTRAVGPRITPGNILADAATFYGRPGNHILEVLMRGYASVGDVKKTRKLFEQIPASKRKPFHLEFILDAYAKRGDTHGARKRFEQIKKALGQNPYVRVWNKLLYAYARNDDLAGASEVFDEMVRSSVEPDAYSFAAILDLMSQRGDVDGVKDMLALAADINEELIRSTAVAGYLVTAFVNDDDIETAELVAEQLQKRSESEQMEGSLTPVWNIIATGHARRRDVHATRRVFQHMVANDIQPNEFTYAALLQVLCLVRNSDAALKILSHVMSEKPVKQMALHYAIVMAGYINQGKYEKVPFVDKLRIRRGIRASLSTRMASVKAVTLSEHSGRYADRENNKKELERTERMLAANLARDDPWERSAEPQTGLGIRTLDQAEGAYLEFVTEIYGERGAFDMVERLLSEYVDLQKRANPSEPDKPPPLRMLLALMNAHFKAQEYDEVERLWNLVLEQAARLTQLSAPTAALHPDSQTPPRSPITSARRHLLSRPLTIYLRTLHFQGRYADAQRTVSGVLAQGYTLDNLAWNLYIQLLARTGRISLAFSLCEKFLMPQWVGWRRKDEWLRRRYRRTRGWEYQNVNANITKPNVVMPQYRTMVILAAAMKYVRRLDAVGGMRANEDGEAPLSETLLKTRYPRTVAALQAMPHINDYLQARFLGDD